MLSRSTARRAAAWRVAVLALGVAGAMLATACTSPPPPGPSTTTISTTPTSSPTGHGLPRIPADAPTLESKTVSFTWVGDMNFGTRGSYPPGGIATIFDGVRNQLKSDVPIANLETVLGTAPLTRCKPATPPAKNYCYLFEAPPSAAYVLRDVGFRVVNIANNHSLDAGTVGMSQTKAALTAAGVAWVGEPGQITYLTANGVHVAVLGFGPYPTSADARDIPGAQAMVKQAKTKAQVVIVVMHMGAEGTAQAHLRPGHEYFQGYDRGDTMGFAHSVIDAGADLVVGSGPHVLRGMQWYKGRLIAYSLGDFSGYHTFSTAGTMGISGILHVTLDPGGGFVKASVTPLRLVNPGTPTVDHAGSAWALMNSLSRADFGATGAIISSNGKIRPPTT